MPGAGTGTRTNNHLVTRQVLDDFVDKREHRGPSAIDETLAADLNDVGIGQDLDDGLPIDQTHLRFIGGTRAH